MRNRHTTVARALPILAGLSPVSSIDVSDVMGRRLKKGSGQLDDL
jgi:hypothetical protein